MPALGQGYKLRYTVVHASCMHHTALHSANSCPYGLQLYEGTYSAADFSLKAIRTASHV